MPEAGTDWKACVTFRRFRSDVLMPSPPPVIVVGAGVIGLSTAIRLLEAGIPVRVRTRERTPHTTSDVAGAVFYPYRAEPRERMAGWGKVSYARFLDLARDAESGVVVSEMLEVLREPSPDPWWAEMVAEFRHADPASLPPGFRDGYRFRTARIDMPRYLRSLERRLVALGGDIEMQEVRDLRALTAEARLVVNCTGLGARELVADGALFPIRGQMVRVACPGLADCLLDENVPGGLTYIVPRRDEVMLGGTAQEGDWSLKPDPETEARILERCRALLPALGRAETLGRVVGLRPGRRQVRLEPEGGERGASIIHNYGHGGAGVTLSWGCAEEVLALVRARSVP
jgi:D-amino-acid oxidase